MSPTLEIVEDNKTLSVEKGTGDARTLQGDKLPANPSDGEIIRFNSTSGEWEHVPKDESVIVDAAPSADQVAVNNGGWSPSDLKASLLKGDGVFSANHASYGADPTETAANNRDAIQSAIDDAESAGGVAAVTDPGTYDLSLQSGSDFCLQIASGDATLVIGAGVTLRLADSQLSGSDIGNVLRIGDGTSSISHISVIGPGTIDGNRANNSSSGNVGKGSVVYVAGPVSEVTIRGVEIQNGTRGGINFLGESSASRGKYVRVLNCDVHDCDEGIKWELVDYFWCIGNRVTSILEQDAIEPIDCSHFWVVGNHCEPHSSNQAIDVFSSSAADIEHGVISGNTIRGSGAGITINSAGLNEARDITVSNNVIDLAGDTDSRCMGVGDGGVCKRINITGNETTGGKDGLTVDADANDTAVFGNVLDSANEMGIRVLSGASDTLLFGNQCTGCGSDGININAGDVVVVGNAARNNSTVGIRFITASGTIQRFVVLANKASDNAYGIQFKNVDDAQIVGNQAHGNSSSDWLIQGTNSGLEYRANLGFVSENWGSASVSDTDTIAHGLSDTPDYINLTAATDKHIAVATAVDGTNITIGLHDDTGTAVTADETVYWEARL